MKGKAILAPEDDEDLAKVKDKLAGAWVLMPVRAACFRPAGGGTAEFRKKLDAAYDEAKIAGFVRSTRGDLILTGGNYQIAWDKLPDRPVDQPAQGRVRRGRGGSRTASRSSSNSTSATTSRRGRSRSTT